MDLSIKKKYIISKTALLGFRPDKNIYLVINNASKREDLKKFIDSDLLNDIGFLPISSNKYSARNAEQWFTIDKTKPKENYSYDIWCTRYRWAGRGKSEPYSGWVSVEKKRWHRNYHNPYEVYFYYDKNNDRFVSGAIPFNEISFPKIKNTVNLLLKVFGECIVTDKDESYLGKIKLENWVFLPSGSWSKDKEKIVSYIGKIKKDERENIEHDLEILTNLKPDEIALGANGFNGYFAFKFDNKRVCVLESKHILNATYIFDTDLWKDLSKKTKTEIIEFNLAKDRIYHKKDWESRLKKYFD